MKHTAITVLMVVFLAAQAAAQEATILKEKMEKESYATGVSLVRNLKQQGGSFDLDLVIRGMKDELTGEKLLLTEEDLQTTVAALRDERMQRSSRPAPARVLTPVRDEEQTLRALAHASIAPASVQQTPASLPSSFQAIAQGTAPQEHTFAALAAVQQQQTNDDGAAQIVLSNLTRRYADLWLKTQPRPR